MNCNQLTSVPDSLKDTFNVLSKILQLFSHIIELILEDNSFVVAE